jgi:hypothetical protein
MSYSTGSAANVGSGEVYGVTTGGTFTVGSLDQISMTPATSSGGVFMTNGLASPTLTSSFVQFSDYSAINANTGTSTADEPFYLVNDSVSGITIFRTSGGVGDSMYIVPASRTDINGSGGVQVLDNFRCDGTVSVGTVSGTGAALYRNATTGILAVVVSDERLKQNVEQIPNALNIVNNLRGVYYNWKDNEDFQSGDSSRQFGFIAQEVEPYLPEAVILSGSKDYKTVKYSEITSVLVEAIKEQQQMIEDLKVEITNLKNRLDNSGI